MENDVRGEFEVFYDHFRNQFWSKVLKNTMMIDDKWHAELFYWRPIDIFADWAF